MRRAVAGRPGPDLRRFAGWAAGEASCGSFFMGVVMASEAEAGSGETTEACEGVLATTVVAEGEAVGLLPVPIEYEGEGPPPLGWGLKRAASSKGTEGRRSR